MTNPVHAAVRNSNGTYTWKEGGLKFKKNQDYSTLHDMYKLENNEKFYRLKTN